MSQPVQVPSVAPGAVDNTDDNGAADQLSRMIAGNDHLVTHPHLVTALMNANATPQQAQAINIFVGGLRTASQVQQAQQAGTKIFLSADDRQTLQALGINPGDTEFTSADLINQINQATNSGPKAKSASHGIFWHLTHNPVTNVLGEAWNVVDYGAGRIGQELRTFGDRSATQKSMQDSDEAMRAAGYDPNNLISGIAYAASGHGYGDLNGLYQNNDKAQVDEAIKYAGDPGAYMRNIVANAASTQDAAQQIDALQKNTAFYDLVLRVQAAQPSIGNMAASSIDPVKHPEAHAITAGVVDTIYSFMLDPTLIAGKAYKVVRASQVGLDTLDSVAGGAKLRGILVDGKGGLWGANVRRGMNTVLDNVKVLIDPKVDDAGKAAAWMTIRTQTPGLVHLASDFTGKLRVTGMDDAGELIMGKGKAITKIEDAATYLESKEGLIRLMNGRPAVTQGLIPGQLSPWGLKLLKGKLATGMLSKGLKNRTRLATIDFNKPGVAERFLQDGEDLATEAAKPVLPSAARGSRSANDIEYGDALNAKRQGVSGQWARIKQTIQRVGSYLPENVTFTTNDPDAAEKVFRYANMYLTRSDAYLLAARYTAGDEGVRKAILTGMHLQTLHAAGFGATAAGRDIIAKVASDMLGKASKSMDTERYSNTLEKIVDPETGIEREAALWPSHMNPTITLTNFSDLQKHAAKLGLFEKMFGWAFKAPLTDQVLKVVRMGWQLTFSNVLRNAAVEDLMHAFSRGELGAALRAKIVERNAGQLPERVSSILASKVGAKFSARAPRAAKVLATTGHWAYWPVAQVWRAYRYGMIKTASKALGLDYLEKLDPEVLRQFAEDFMNMHMSSMVDPAGASEASRIVGAGFTPRRVKFRAGMEEATTEDLIGAGRLSAHLTSVIDGNPELVQTLLDFVTDPKPGGLDAAYKLLKNDPRITQSIRAGIFEDSGSHFKAITKGEKKRAIYQMAAKQAQELRYLIEKQDGDVSDKLVDYVREHHVAPTSDWIMENLANEERPKSILAPIYESVEKTSTKAGWISAIADKTGVGYKFLVERPIARMSSLPIFGANYGKERVLLARAEKELVDGGMTPVAADRWAQDLAMKRAWSRTAKQIDDPTLRTQMDVVGRNFFAYSRATQAFIRRWGGSFVEDPTRLRKLMLGMEGAQQTGLVYDDVNGQRQVAFPCSGAAINALMDVFGLQQKGMGGLVPNLSGRFQLLNAGLQNPLQFSLTPLVNIPMRFVFNLFPQHKLALDQVDAFFNGTQGQGANLLQELEPTAYKKFSDALNGDDKESLYADAARAAIYNMSAAGLVPPPTADAAEIQSFLTSLHAQIKNQMIIKAMFGFFTPTPPGVPSEDTAGSKADWMYGAAGVHGLSDEFRQILNDADGDYGKATQIWAGIHPDKMFYTVGTTTGTKSASINPTQEAEGWMQQNLGFMTNYKDVSAYFVPKNLQDGKFDLGAWNAELALGVRQHKDLLSFYKDVVSANASTEYFQMVADRDAALAAQPWKKSEIAAAFATKKADLFAQNPVFARAEGDFGTARDTADAQIGELTRMVQNPGTVPAGVPLDQVKAMLDTYTQYHAALTAWPAGSNVADYHRAQLAGQYNSMMLELVAHSPLTLGGLYAGVFRVLDPQVLDPLGRTS
jgi:hypothetical protein